MIVFYTSDSATLAAGYPTRGRRATRFSAAATDPMSSPQIMWQATSPRTRAMTRTEKMGSPAYRMHPIAVWVVALVAGIIALTQNATQA